MENFQPALHRKMCARTIHTDCEVCAVNMTECAGTALNPLRDGTCGVEPEPSPAENTGTLLLILAVAVLGGGGAGWYLKIYRPKHEKPLYPKKIT